MRENLTFYYYTHKHYVHIYILSRRLVTSNDLWHSRSIVCDFRILKNNNTIFDENVRVHVSRVSYSTLRIFHIANLYIIYKLYYSTIHSELGKVSIYIRSSWRCCWSISNKACKYKCVIAAVINLQIDLYNCRPLQYYFLQF